MHTCTHMWQNMHTNLITVYLLSGPKLEEVAIFWQMVMEQKPAVVVMLTKVEENGKVNLTLYTTKTIVRIGYAVLTEQHAICFHC